MSVRPINALRARSLGLDTQYEAVAFLRADCPVCKSEGFSSHARIQITNGNTSIFATLYTTDSDLLAPDEIGLSTTAWVRLGLDAPTDVTLSHPPPLTSLAYVRGKIFGRDLTLKEMTGIVSDIVAGRFSDIHLAAFVTAISAQPLSLEETIFLTRAMVEAGDCLRWETRPIADKHCIGGLPGNRTTPIIVAICAALGLTFPKTSSRAITSPSGTADTMEAITRVALTLEDMKRVVEAEGGCFAWGGSVNFSPADDAMIRIERALDIDAPGPLVASVLSKKVAAGATHIVIDIPVGPTAKIRSEAAALDLKRMFLQVGAVLDLKLAVELTDGHQPVGRGIGPALEARDVLGVLRQSPDAPQDLRDRACALAGALLELVGVAPPGEGHALALSTLADGAALTKFEAICHAQGRLSVPAQSMHSRPVCATRSGRISDIDNRRLSRVAKLAGAPQDKAAGLDLHVRLGQHVQQGDPLYTLHTESTGELAYAIDYVRANPDIIDLTS
jgi:thymidine phosphorylase